MKRWIPILMLAMATLAHGQPNIVLIFADDLDADEIAVTADDTEIWPTPSGAHRMIGKNVKAGSSSVLTPRIDSLAANGMLFTRFYVNATVCTSSRYSLLTGRYATRGPELHKDYAPGTHCTLEWRPNMLRSETNLPKELQKLGYRTGIIGKWHNMPQKILPRRNKKAHAANATVEMTREHEADLKAYYDAGMAYLSEGYGWDVVDRMEWGNSIVNLDWQCEGALNFLEESREGPFFLYCALPVPHGQYSFPYNQIESYDPRVTSYGLLEEPMALLPSTEDVFRRVDEAGVPRINAMATRMDDYVGAVLDKLDELGVRDNTIVLYTSDHGSRGKNSVYEGGAKVPLLVEWPGRVEAGSRSDSLVGSIDISATLIELAGGNLPEDMARDNRSFVPQLTGAEEPEDWRTTMLIEAGNSKGVVSRDWKYVVNRVTPEIEAKMKARPGEVFWTGFDHHNYGNENMYPSFWDADQLFDLNADLYEQKNLYGDPAYAGPQQAMREALSAYVADLPHTFGEF